MIIFSISIALKKTQYVLLISSHNFHVATSHTRVCYSHVVWQVERYTGFRGISVLEEAKEAYAGVEQDNEEHSGVEDSGTADEVSRSLHVVLQRHHLEHPDYNAQMNPLPPVVSAWGSILLLNTQ
jgi:hypothetical protein